MLLIEARHAITCLQIGDRFWIASRAPARSSGAAVVQRLTVGVLDQCHQAVAITLGVLDLKTVVVRSIDRVFLRPGGDIVERLDESAKGCGCWPAGLNQADR